MKISITSTLLIAGTFVFFVGCQKQFLWNVGATGTLKDAQGICMPLNVRGNLYKGAIAQSDINYIEAKVNVFTTGSYLINTNNQNGLSFADSGTFNSTGLHTIKLKPTGKPLSSGTSDFTICFDTSCCPTSVTIKDSSGNEPINAWQFTDTKKNITYKGPITATYFLETPLAALLSLRMESTSENDTTFQIGIAFQNKMIGTGSFKTDSLNEVALSAKSICINCAWEVMYKLHGITSTITVTSYDPSTKVIKGTFSGTTIDSEDNKAPITGGVFSAVIK